MPVFLFPHSYYLKFKPKAILQPIVAGDFGVNFTPLVGVGIKPAVWEPTPGGDIGRCDTRL
jgi:hypothetical protein